MKSAFSLSSLRDRWARHRKDLLDPFSLWAAMILVERYFLSTSIGGLLQLIALGLAILLPQAREHTADSARWAQLRRLLRQLIVSAAFTFIWFFFFNVPLATGAGVGGLWIFLNSCVTIGWRGYGEKIFAWLTRHAERHRSDILLGESLIFAGVFVVSAGLVPKLWPASVGLFFPGLIVAWVVLSHLLGLARSSLSWRHVTLTVASVAALAGWIQLSGTWQHAHTVAFVWLFAGLTLYRVLLDRCADLPSGNRGENFRWIALGLAAWVLLHPFLQAAVHGTGDALWYATMLADMVAQTRAGDFPVFIGQSIYQFNGSIYPLRVAPAFHHVAVIADLLTGRALPPVALLNALLFGVGSLALITTYVCLRALLPTARWFALGLTLLYVSCPGTLGIVFNTDLYMSWMTVPWLPVAIYGTVRAFTRPDLRAYLLLGGSLGLLWWGHAPIALWSTLLLGIIQVGRLIARRPNFFQIKSLVAGAGLFLLIAAYPIGSVVFFPPEPGVKATGFQTAIAHSIVRFLKESSPAVYFPLSPNGRLLSDFQLGYVLWAGLGLCLWQLKYRRSGAQIALTAAAAWLAILLNPIPGTGQIFWDLIPAFVRNTTGNWAMNRLYLIQSCFLVFTLAGLLATVDRFTAKARRVLGFTLIVGCVWSLLEAGKFATGSRRGLRSPASGLQAMYPENIQLTRFAYLVFPRLPSYFTHGVTDATLENRLLRADGSILTDNFTAAASGRPALEANFKAVPPAEGNFQELETSLKLSPGHRYVLACEFFAPVSSEGIFQLSSPAMLREYALPEYGESASFGLGGRHGSILALENSSPSDQDVRVRFFPSAAVPTGSLRSLARVRLVEYDPAQLPVSVESWIPYRAKVTAPAAAWLETPRMYQPAYVATVDGRAAEIRKSAEGLVSIAVPAGSSKVELRYVAPSGLSAIYWCSLLASGAWIAGLLVVGAISSRLPLNDDLQFSAPA